MDVREIPRILFQEFAQNVREQNGMTIGNLPSLEGVILGLEEKGNGNIVLRWWVGEERIGRSDYSVIEIEAGSREAGVWKFGAGRAYEEGVWFRMAIGRWSLGESTLLIAQVVKRASELALSGSIEPTGFWESDHHPDKDYRRPP